MSTQVPSLYDVETVARLTGLSRSLLHRWGRDGFFTPAHPHAYSFRDLVSLRVLAELRVEYKVSRQALRKATVKLKEEAETPWASLEIGIVGREVVFRDPKTGLFISTKPHGQHVDPQEIVRVSATRREVTKSASKLLRRTATELGRFERRRGLMGGAEVFKGTRIPVSEVVEAIKLGVDQGEILAMYPSLTARDVHAAQQRRRSA